MLCERKLFVLTPNALHQQPSPLLNVAFIVILFAVMYFLIIRPQMKRQKEQKLMLAALQKGDEVVTVGGLVGKMVKVGITFVVLEISREVEVTVQKTAICTVLPKGTIHK